MPDDSQVFYLCKRGNRCNEQCFEECNHTTVKENAKNRESVEAMELVLKHFDSRLDEDGNIIFVEKETK